MKMMTKILSPSERTKIWRAANLERARAKDREIAKRRNKLPHAIEIKLAWMKRNPEKRRAHWMLREAIKKGEVAKQTACFKCGVEGRIEAHHPDYSKPLEVVWLCRIHHVEAHRDFAF